MKLTKATVAGLTLPAGSDDKIYWDDDIPLFGVRLRKGGSKRWVFWYRLGGRASPSKAETTSSPQVSAVRMIWPLPISFSTSER